MSLIYCPECGHEISQAAIACPSCGRPINAAPAPVIDRVVVPKQPRTEGFPPWAYVPLAILGLGLLFLIFYAMQRNDETAESNLNVNVSSQRASSRSRDADRSGETHTTTLPPSDSTTITVPPTGSQTVTVPGSQTTIPADAVKGKVVIDARVSTPSGSQAVRNEKFYLLDKDLDAILMDADLDPIEGQTLSNSFGLSVVFPDRYGDFNRKALSAIKDHIKYTGMTDASGKATLGNIDPDSYYLFGITKTGKGFALWSNPVTIQTGENILNLSPQRITEMAGSSE